MKFLKHSLFSFMVLAAGILTALSQEPQGAGSPYRAGNPGARVKIEVFNDLQCPTCASYNKTLKAIEDKFPDTVSITFRSYPLTQVHKHAYQAALAVEAAGKQGKYREMMDRLYERQAKWSAVNSTDRAFRNYAKRIGLDVEQFVNDIAGDEVKSRVDLDLERGKYLQITGTPSIIVDGEQLSYPEFSNLEKIIRKKLNL